MAERIACVVPFCRRTRKPQAPPPEFAGRAVVMEWICSVHWPLVPRRLRRLSSLARRRKKRIEVQSYIWEKCKAAAIERAGGFA